MEWAELILGLSPESRTVHAANDNGQKSNPTTVPEMRRRSDATRCRSHATTEGLVAALREHRGTVVEVKP